MPVILLEQWFLQQQTPAAPESPACLVGKILDAQGEEADAWVINPVGYRGENIVVASGAEYQLGDVQPDYERKNPGARDTIIARVHEALPDLA
ncbi:MAG: hypothetical protein WBK55_01980 [Alphaproteobacteria bacterium]